MYSEDMMKIQILSHIMAYDFKNFLRGEGWWCLNLSRESRNYHNSVPSSPDVLMVRIR